MNKPDINARYEQRLLHMAKRKQDPDCAYYARIDKMRKATRETQAPFPAAPEQRCYVL